MRAICRRFSSNAAYSCAHQSQTVPTSVNALTPKERDQIAALPFFSESSFQNSKTKKTSAKQEYLEKKLPDVERAFGLDPTNPGYLSYNLPKDRPNPYLDAHLGRTVDPDTGEQLLHGKRRLSVTKLLTKRWCELREAYDLYAKAPIYEHAQVVEGLATHQKLEDETHPIPEEWQDFVEDFEVAIPKDAFHEFVGSWHENVVKLTNLFTVGEAREVLCHGYLNSNTCEMVKGPVTSEGEVLVSGIIDHLFLTRRGENHIKPQGSGGCISYVPTLDISNALSQIQDKRDKLTERYEVIMSDVKTRSIRRVPTQNSVVKSTKLQVMYYRTFMETLGSSPSLTYEKLLLNARRRGLDVDQPIEPSKLISMMAAGDLITSDMRRLRDGENIGFKPFDDFSTESSQSAAYDLAHFYDLITDMRVVQKFEEFFTLWSKPPTLRYFAARLAQLYHEVAPLLSDSLLIEYYYKGENFHNIRFNYDRELVKSECSNSAKFWFGKRDIEPIEPTLKNVMTYCKYCDYEAVCLWRKQATEKSRQLGNDLAQISQE